MREHGNEVIGTGTRTDPIFGEIEIIDWSNPRSYAHDSRFEKSKIRQGNLQAQRLHADDLL
jgi:hypothetical protein